MLATRLPNITAYLLPFLKVLNILIFIDTVETRVKKFGKTYHKENLKEEIIKATIEIIVNEEVESVLMRALATLVIFFCSAIVTVITTRNF